MRLLRTSSCSRRTHLAPLAVVVAHPKHLGKPAFRAVFHHRREALDRQVAEYFVHPSVMVEVSVRDDGQGDGLDAHLGHVVSLLAVGAGVDHDPLAVGRPDHDAVRLSSVEDLHPDRAKGERLEGCECEDNDEGQA